jgi:hypothetical protein
MSTRTAERRAAIDRMIDVLARRFGEIPEPGVNWGSLLEFADLADRIEAGEMPISIKEAVREQLAGLAERQAARAEKRRTRNRQALARKRLPPEQRVDGRVKGGRV